jgi:Kef-type K+ transport systems, membrane components
VSPSSRPDFSPSGLALLLAEITGYILLVLFGLSRLGAYLLSQVKDEEDAYFIVMLSIMAIAGVLADAIQLPGIVGAFLAGLAVNASAREAPASAKASISRQIAVYSNLLYRHRLSD